MATERQKPQKIVSSTLQTWRFKASNDATILRVLKRIGLLKDAGEPTESYGQFMKRDGGPATLGSLVRTTYKDLFDHVADPARASNDELTNFFNIHSGGSESSIHFQVGTFKALADSAHFERSVESPVTTNTVTDQTVVQAPSSRAAVLHIDLHVHRPEN